MARVIICDVCRRPTKRLVFKLYLGEWGNRNSHADYTHHADIGECCAANVQEMVRWQKRIKNKAPAKKRQQRRPKLKVVEQQ